MLRNILKYIVNKIKRFFFNKYYIIKIKYPMTGYTKELLFYDMKQFTKEFYNNSEKVLSAEIVIKILCIFTLKAIYH